MITIAFTIKYGKNIDTYLHDQKGLCLDYVSFYYSTSLYFQNIYN